MPGFGDKLRFKLLSGLIRIRWACESLLENQPVPVGSWRRQFAADGVYFFATLPAFAISLIIAGANFGANLILSSLLAPKPSPQVRGKLTGEITLTDSLFGAEIPRMYGGRTADTTPGGFELGCNIHWMSEIRTIRTQSPSGSGGGGKGAPPPNITVNHKVDIAGIVGAGRLRLLRMKWNDTVYSIIGGIGGTPVVEHYEAEDAANTLLGSFNRLAISRRPGGKIGGK